jgi:hypothetical protein
MSFSLRLFNLTLNNFVLTHGFLRLLLFPSQKISISNDPLQQEETYGGKSASFVAIFKLPEVPLQQKETLLISV